ncbi:hypothetical protein E5288_WYG019043 [Bos mutus]|uniref:Uncharacterized protein n=1 Tax=Bos mutus TaxID=72004 RepID=A0A6B0SAN2_9CETA|nr:hypothetical protein [Bos mutus]
MKSRSAATAPSFPWVHAGGLGSPSPPPPHEHRANQGCASDITLPGSVCVPTLAPLLAALSPPASLLTPLGTCAPRPAGTLVLLAAPAGPAGDLPLLDVTPWLLPALLQPGGSVSPMAVPCSRSSALQPLQCCPVLARTS